MLHSYGCFCKKDWLELVIDVNCCVYFTELQMVTAEFEISSSKVILMLKTKYLFPLIFVLTFERTEVFMNLKLYIEKKFFKCSFFNVSR